MFGLAVSLCFVFLSLQTNACKLKFELGKLPEMDETENETNATLAEFMRKTTDDIKELVDGIDRMRNNFSEAYVQFQEMKLMYANLTEELQDLKNKIEDKHPNPVDEITTSSTTVSSQTISTDTAMCPIHYKQKCYLPLVNAKISLESAQNACGNLSGQLANIYDETHFNLILNTLRSYKFMKNERSIILRLGMSVNESTGEAFLSDGKSAPYYRWCPNYPLEYRLFNSVTLNVARSPSEYMQYMQNTDARIHHYSLCEI